MLSETRGQDLLSSTCMNASNPTVKRASNLAFQGRWCFKKIDYLHSIQNKDDEVLKHHPQHFYGLFVPRPEGHQNKFFLTLGKVKLKVSNFNHPSLVEVGFTNPLPSPHNFLPVLAGPLEEQSHQSAFNLCATETMKTQTPCGMKGFLQRLLRL